MKVLTRFWTTSDFTASNFGVEQDIVNRKSALKIIEIQLGGFIILFTLVH